MPAKVNISRKSRLRFSKLVEVDSVSFWEKVEYPTDLTGRGGEQEYQVVAGDRIDTLANRYYGDPRYWWVIAVANGMEILPIELNLGDILIIPSPVIVRSLRS